MTSSWTPRTQALAYARVHEAIRRARLSITTLRHLDNATKCRTLQALIELLLQRVDDILEANDADLSVLPNPGALPRLLIVTRARVEALADQLRRVAVAPEPLGEVLHSTRQRGGTYLYQLRIPIGLVVVLFDDPTMLVRAAAMLLKAGNATLLHHMRSPVPRTEITLMSFLHEVLHAHGVPAECAALLRDDNRTTTRHLLNAHQGVDLVLPLQHRPVPSQLRAESRVLVAEVGPARCHLYIDASADIDLAIRLVLDSKSPFATAVDEVLVHADVAASVIPRLESALAARNITMHVDAQAAPHVRSFAHAGDIRGRSGYGAPDIGCSVVDSTIRAITHINRFGGGHTEAVVASDSNVVQRFLAGTDAAMVIVNGATTSAATNANPLEPELGFSTRRLAPRGPLTLSALTTTQWVAAPVMS